MYRYTIIYHNDCFGWVFNMNSLLQGVIYSLILTSCLTRNVATSEVVLDERESSCTVETAVRALQGHINRVSRLVISGDWSVYVEIARIGIVRTCGLSKWM